MTHIVKLCDNQSQDQWAALYMRIARSLVSDYGVAGKGVVREGVRRFAALMARDRTEALLSAGCKINLKTFFSYGFGFPCGDRTQKEWVRHTEQELFLNVAACPFADCWKGGEPEIGRIFCEEYYAALVRAGISEKAQTNLGYTMLNSRDASCCLAIYFRPANLPSAQRAQCFPAFDPEAGNLPDELDYKPDYERQKLLLVQSFFSAAEERGEGACIETIRRSIREYAREYHDPSVLPDSGETAP